MNSGVARVHHSVFDGQPVWVRIEFVEFYGPGAAALPVVDRATIANMAPEYGATMGFFPVDAECVSYLRATGLRLALVINFNVEWLRHGIGRVVL